MSPLSIDRPRLSWAIKVLNQGVRLVVVYDDGGFVCVGKEVYCAAYGPTVGAAQKAFRRTLMATVALAAMNTHVQTPMACPTETWDELVSRPSAQLKRLAPTFSDQRC